MSSHRHGALSQLRGPTRDVSGWVDNGLRLRTRPGNFSRALCLPNPKSLERTTRRSSAAITAGERSLAPRSPHSAEMGAGPGVVERLPSLDRGFFGKRLVSPVGIPVLAAPCVSDAALEEASRRLTKQLSRAAVLRENLRELGCEVQIIGKDQNCSDLPEYKHMGKEEAEARASRRVSF